MENVEKLIEKLRQSDMLIYAIMQNYIDKLKAGATIKCIDECILFLSGVLWTLYSFDFITSEERSALYEEIVYIAYDFDLERKG